MTTIETIQSKIFENTHAFYPILKQWRQANNLIVFTNGCFDLLHRGHIDSLSKAAEFGDRLVVGLNADLSLKLLKGEGRPINDQRSRSIMLASLFMVDAVILFYEETPYEMIKAIRPDVLAKGSNYKIQEIIGFDIVLAYGGRVEQIDITEGFSTTDLIDKITLKFRFLDK